VSMGRSDYATMSMRLEKCRIGLTSGKVTLSFLVLSSSFKSTSARCSGQRTWWMWAHRTRPSAIRATNSHASANFKERYLHSVAWAERVSARPTPVPPRALLRSAGHGTLAKTVCSFETLIDEKGCMVHAGVSLQVDLCWLVSSSAWLRWG
jgi:hypothetical protein